MEGFEQSTSVQDGLINVALNPRVLNYRLHPCRWITTLSTCHRLILSAGVDRPGVVYSCSDTANRGYLQCSCLEDTYLTIDDLEWSGGRDRMKSISWMCSFPTIQTVWLLNQSFDCGANGSPISRRVEYSSSFRASHQDWQTRFFYD